MKELANIFYILRVATDLLELQTLLAHYLFSGCHRQYQMFAMS